MRYIEDAFKRTHIQHVREFMLYGAGETDISDLTYEERLEEVKASMYARLEKLYENDEERENAIDDLDNVLFTYTDIYTEIGIKLGAKLMCELLLSDKAR